MGERSHSTLSWLDDCWDDCRVLADSWRGFEQEEPNTGGERGLDESTSIEQREDPLLSLRPLRVCVCLLVCSPLIIYSISAQIK